MIPLLLLVPYVFSFGHSSYSLSHLLFQYAHFLIANLDVLYALEEDIMDVNVPERPNSAKCYKPAYLDEHEPDARDQIDEMVETMKEKKSNSITTGHWALDAFSHYTWRIAHQKNQNRDFPKFAAAAYFEESLVLQYRRNLFKQSDVARFLRFFLRVRLSTFVKPRNIIKKGKTSEYKYYDFPDKIKVSHTNRPDFDIKDVISANEEVTYITNACKSIQSIKKSITSHPSAKLKPGKTSTLNPAVDAAIKNLEKVRLSLSFPFSFSPFNALQGAHHKCQHLAKNVR